MTYSPQIMALAGSLRKHSYNRKLVKLAELGAERAGAEVVRVDLCDYGIPLYDGDLETGQGIPVGVRSLKNELNRCGGLLVAAPEYNGSISGVLKNAIDWLSRPDGEEPRCACFQSKVVALMSASVGAHGGAKGLVHTRSVLANVGCLVLPGQVCVGNAATAFAADGSLLDPELQRAVEEQGAAVARALKLLKG